MFCVSVCDMIQYKNGVSERTACFGRTGERRAVARYVSESRTGRAVPHKTKRKGMHCLSKYNVMDS